MTKDNTVYIKKIDDTLEELKSRILNFTNIQVKKMNGNDLNEILEKELAVGEIRCLNGGNYPQYISLAKSDYERLSEEKVSIVDNNKILGMGVKLRNE